MEDRKLSTQNKPGILRSSETSTQTRGKTVSDSASDYSAELISTQEPATIHTKPAADQSLQSTQNQHRIRVSDCHLLTSTDYCRPTTNLDSMPAACTTT